MIRAGRHMLIPGDFMGVRVRAPASGGISPLMTGLLVYWPLNEESGNRADLHTNGYTLTEGGTLGADTGLVYPKAAVFAPLADNYVARAHASCALLRFSSATAHTIAVWCYPTAFDVPGDSPTYYRQIINYNLASSFSGGWQIMSTTQGQAYVQLGKTGGPPLDGWHVFDGGAAAIKFTLNSWNLFVWTHEAGSHYAWLNGSTGVYSTIYAFTAPTGGYVSVGIRAPTTPTQNYAGRIGPIACWNRALSSDEITELYNAGLGKAYPF